MVPRALPVGLHLLEGREMKKKTSYLLVLLLTLSFSVVHGGWAQPKPEGKPPLITSSFAVEKGSYGYIWRIYIEAEDSDADMVKIASVVNHVGYGQYPTDWIILKPQYQHYLKGYLQWNTSSAKTPYLKDWNQITLKVFIIDKAGNQSNVVVFPFIFLSGVRDQYNYKLPSPFDQGDLPRLGYITIDLVEPTFGDSGPKDQ
jgi:hypothetical protein